MVDPRVDLRADPEGGAEGGPEGGPSSAVPSVIDDSSLDESGVLSESPESIGKEIIHLTLCHLHRFRRGLGFGHN